MWINSSFFFLGQAIERAVCLLSYHFVWGGIFDIFSFCNYKMVNTKNVYKPLGAHKWFVIRLKAKINTQKKPIMSSDCACALLFFVPIIFLLYSLCVFVSQIWRKEAFIFGHFLFVVRFITAHNYCFFVCVCANLYSSSFEQKKWKNYCRGYVAYVTLNPDSDKTHTHTNTDKEVQDGGIELGYIWIAY